MNKIRGRLGSISYITRISGYGGEVVGWYLPTLLPWLSGIIERVSL